MAGITNRGKKRILDSFFKDTSQPVTFYMALCTSAITPTDLTNTMADLTQVANGNGYNATAGGVAITRNATGFDVGSTETDASGLAYIQIKDVVYTASGGNLPSDSVGARWAVLTTDEATVATRDVIAYFDLVSARVVSTGQSITLQNCEIRGTE